MKRHVALSLGMLAVLTAVTAWAAPPAKLTYQGVLTNTSGQIVPDGAYPLAFKLYDGPALAANTIWSGAAQQVTVSKGIFTATLAGGNPDLGTVSFDRPLFLGITVAGGVELTPRIELTAAPYSMGTNLSPGQISAVHVANRQVVKGIIVNGDTLRDEISLVGGTNVTLTPSDQASQSPPPPAPLASTASTRATAWSVVAAGTASPSTCCPARGLP